MKWMSWKRWNEEYEIPKGLLPFLSGLVAVVIIGGSAVYVGLHGNPFKTYAVAHEVKQYLIEQKGYTAKDITSVQGAYSFKTDHDAYTAMVVFQDEPHNVYEYHIVENEHAMNEQVRNNKHIHGDQN
ncbi:DUF3139 domain-containing protein [Paenibacillus sp. WLX2291]|uniref:DUF3139 domain-containing protein n=1 Tax=Paenibacillus sp. WLX2291 TaxID=3296934 RepID=UPI00398420E7